MARRMFAALTIVAIASLPAMARQDRPADAPPLNEQLVGQAGETPPITLSRLAAGVRHYPAKLIRSLLLLGENPLVLRQLADNPELVGNPDNIAPPIDDGLKAAIRELAAAPALIAIAAAHPAEMRLLRQVYAEAPDGVEQRIAELRTSFTQARLEAAAAWQTALEHDPAALGEYRKLLTAFTRQQQKDFDNFPFVHVTQRDYYYAAPPNEAIIAYAEEHRGEMKSLWRALTNYWTDHRPEELDGRALARDRQPAPAMADDVIAAAPAEARSAMWKSADGNVPGSIGFMPVIMQPLADQPPEARYAFAIADHARLWTTQAPLAAREQPVDAQPAPRRLAQRPVAEPEYVEEYVEVDRVEYVPVVRYYDPYDYYGASVSYRYYYSSVFPYYYGYPHYSPIYAGAFPYYGGYYHLHDRHRRYDYYGAYGRVGRGRVQISLSFGSDRHDDRRGRDYGSRYAERTLYPRALHEPRDHSSRGIRSNASRTKTVQRRTGNGRSAASLLTPSVRGGRSTASNQRTIPRRSGSTPIRANRSGRTNADRALAGQSNRSLSSRIFNRNARGTSGVTRRGSSPAQSRSITRTPSASRSSRSTLQRSNSTRRSSGGISRLPTRGNTQRSSGSTIRRSSSSRTPARTIGRRPAISTRRTFTPPSRSSASRSTARSPSRSASVNRSNVSRSRSSSATSRSTRTIGRRSTGNKSPRRRP
ncbi:MAG: hypothetical protein IID33_08090 [Planctomycetes bacterium]|nr:hypothetical protein [Planctomycetota bacterium]